MLIEKIIFVLLLAQDQTNISLIVREFVQVFALKVFLWKIQQKNVRLLVQQDMLNLQQDIVLLNALEIHKHMLIYLLKLVYIDV